MNKTEKIVVVLLVLVLVGWLWHSFNEQKKEAARRAELAAQEAVQARDAANRSPVGPVATNATAVAKVADASAMATNAVASAPKVVRVHKVPEQVVVLSNAEVAVSFTTRGAAVKKATLFGYAEGCGAISAENPPLTLDFSSSPALALEGVAGLEPDDDYEVAEQGADFVVFRHAAATRRLTLKDGYRIELEETFSTPAAAANRLSLGCMAMGSSKNDMLSIDSMTAGSALEKAKVLHHGEEEPLKSYLVGAAGGCGGKRSAEGIPETSTVDVPGAQAWLAVKNRFFVTALAKASETNVGFRATMVRDMARSDYALKTVAASAAYPTLSAKRGFTLYVGPKKQSLLWDLGMRDVMEYGMWRWFCYPIVWLLNACHAVVPSYGIAIILLTLLVRVLFWPLTHKSTVGMRRMQEIQPKLKALQARFKDNPQRLQQETWQLYRTEKVNPMSSCLPMLVQIPVFIALFNVLRASVELRYAPFLWIADLSEPEGLFSSWFPFGGLNILPILMAATMALQSALTPSTGDKNQQRMMMVMMPVMMLVMFYSFPSALSLYWTLSQVFSIAQMWWIRKKYGTPEPKPGVIEPEVVDMPQTRQMRRHGIQK
ncbi:MAG: membrane protein insertase YidC [Kiritimatiellae bacterium]|nr:membrane protein insertase YidC [Kiritimatiellia bacterium]